MWLNVESWILPLSALISGLKRIYLISGLKIIPVKPKLIWEFVKDEVNIVLLFG